MRTGTRSSPERSTRTPWPSTRTGTETKALQTATLFATTEIADISISNFKTQIARKKIELQRSFIIPLFGMVMFIGEKITKRAGRVGY